MSRIYNWESCKSCLINSFPSIFYFPKVFEIWLGKQVRTYSYSLISIRQNYNFDMLAMIWHEIVCWFLKIYQYLKRFAAREQRIVFVLTFRCAEQFYVPNRQKRVKIQKSTDNHSSFDGIIQENINLSGIY